MVAVLHVLFKPASEHKQTHTNSNKETVNLHQSISLTCPSQTKHLFTKLISLWGLIGDRKVSAQLYNLICFVSGEGQHISVVGTKGHKEPKGESAIKFANKTAMPP